MAVRVGVNGFGRIGMLFTKAAMQRGDIEVVAVNDLVPFASLENLFKHDSTHGIWHEDVSYEDDVMRVGDREIKTFSEKNPSDIPWGDLGVDVVVESSGVFTDDSAGQHLDGGAKKVVISAPAKGIDGTFIYDINHKNYDPDSDNVISNGSCTTNCIVPMAKVLIEQFGMESGLMITCHAYTNDQSIVDAAHKDPRRARAAAQNIIPTSTGAAKLVGTIFPQMEGKIDGMALRVPVSDGSITDLTAQLSQEVSAEDINAAFKEAASGELSHILEYSEAPLVSSDIVGNPHSCVFDSGSTMSMGKTVKVLGWYDNEWGYSSRTCDLVAYVGEQL